MTDSKKKSSSTQQASRVSIGWDLGSKRSVSAMYECRLVPMDVAIDGATHRIEAVSFAPLRECEGCHTLLGATIRACPVCAERRAECVRQNNQNAGIEVVSG